MICSTLNFYNSMSFQSFNPFRVFLSFFVSMTQLTLVMLSSHGTPRVQISILVTRCVMSLATSDLSNGQASQRLHWFRFKTQWSAHLQNFMIFGQTQGHIVITSHKSDSFWSTDMCHSKFGNVFRVCLDSGFSVQLWSSKVDVAVSSDQNSMILRGSDHPRWHIRESGSTRGNKSILGHPQRQLTIGVPSKGPLKSSFIFNLPLKAYSVFVERDYWDSGAMGLKSMASFLYSTPLRANLRWIVGSHVHTPWIQDHLVWADERARIYWILNVMGSQMVSHGWRRDQSIASLVILLLIVHILRVSSQRWMLFLQKVCLIVLWVVI